MFFQNGLNAGAGNGAAPLEKTEFVARFGQGQNTTPYADAVRGYGSRAPLSFMVPGHGNDPAKGANHIAEYFGDAVAMLDVPLLLKGIDQGDNSPLEQSLKLAANAWGAKRTWFMTNGASQANRTAALAVRGLGERILVQRSMHSSLTDGVLVSGMQPAFVMPTVDHFHGIAHGLTPEMLEDALRREHLAGRPVSSVYVVSPSYFGSTADVAGLSEVAHRYEAALIVDNAWGAHFGFHPELPESPARLGADLVISSTHKLAGSLTQSAMLHLGEGPFAERLEPLVDRAYRMTSSTSMSAILMSSLDLARRAMATGYEHINRSIQHAKELRELLRQHDLLGVVSDDFAKLPDVAATDLLRLPIDVSKLGQTGHWVRDRLIQEHGVFCEMSTGTTVVLVIGALRDFDVQETMRAFAAVAAEAVALGGNAAEEFPELPGPGQMRMLPAKAFFGESELVPAAEAVGRISADTLAAYPPGIPNLLPGEEISAETVAFLTAVAASPTGYVRGAADSKVSMLRVVK